MNFNSCLPVRQGRPEADRNSKRFIEEHPFHTTLKSFINKYQLQRKRCLELGMEGYEGQVLKVAQEILNRDKPILFLEIHPSIIPEFGFSVGQILDDLSSIYKETTCYECQPNENIDFIKKISLRYIDKDPLVKVKNIPQYISKCAEGEITRPFWAICKN
jgi:hypothetical protein